MVASNYLGPFLLTSLVLERVKAAARLALSSSARRHTAAALLFNPDRFEHLGRYGPMNSTLAYARTKLLDMLFARSSPAASKGPG